MPELNLKDQCRRFAYGNRAFVPVELIALDFLAASVTQLWVPWRPLCSDDIAQKLTHIKRAWIGMGTPGVIGCRNMGNTGFISSILLCMSNSQPLNEYFLSDRYLEELNVSNDLGCGVCGRLEVSVCLDAFTS